MKTAVDPVFVGKDCLPPASPGARAAQAEGLGQRRPPNRADPVSGADRRLGSGRGSLCEAPAGGIHSADVVLNIVFRRREPGPVPTILTPDALRLQHLPIADCARYDSLRGVG